MLSPDCGYLRYLMAMSPQHPRGPNWLRDRRPLSPQARLAALGYGVVLALLLAVTVAAAISGSGPFAGDDSANDASNDLPSGWVSLEPLLPLTPGLKEMSALRQSARGGPSRVLGARDGSEGTLRLRELPSAGPAVSAGRVVAARAPVRARPARPLPTGFSSGVPLVDRVVGTPRLPGLGDLKTIIDRDLGDLPGETVPDIDVQIPPIGPLPVGIPRPPVVVIPPIEPVPGVGTPPVGNPLPGTPPVGGNPLPGTLLPGTGPGGVDPLPVGSPLGGGTGPRPSTGINITLGDLRADVRFDVLLVSSGRRVLERYVFADSDIAGLSAQINLRSRLLAAEALRDQPLAPVVAASLSSGDPADAGAQQTGVQSGSTERPGSLNAGRGGGADKAALASSGARAGGGPRGGGRRSSSGSAGGGGSSSPDSSSGSPRRARGSGSRTTQPSRGRSRPSRVSRGRSPRGSRPSGGNRPSRGNRPSQGKGSRSRGRGRPSRGSRGSGRGHGGGRGDDEGDDDD